MSKKLNTKGLTYDIKILLAWGESISGNKKITDFLMKNIPELGLFYYALRNEVRAQKWLMDHKHPHLMALINGIEGNKEALAWLKKHDFELLHQMALAADGDTEAYKRLAQGEYKIFAMLAKKMEVFKDSIEERNNDPHIYKSSS